MHTETKTKQNPHKPLEVHKNNLYTTTEPLPSNGQQPKLLGGGLNAFYWRQIFALDSVGVKTQKMFN